MTIRGYHSSGMTGQKPTQILPRLIPIWYQMHSEQNELMPNGCLTIQEYILVNQTVNLRGISQVKLLKSEMQHGLLKVISIIASLYIGATLMREDETFHPVITNPGYLQFLPYGII